MEDDREPDSTIEVEDQDTSATATNDNENPVAANEADPGGDVIIIK